MNILTLDLETYFDRQYSLKKLTIPEYVHDPRFSVHGIAIRWPSGESEFEPNVPRALSRLQEAFGESLEATTVVGHNLGFDLYVLNHRYDFRPAHLVDTLLLARHVHPRGSGQGWSLEELAKRCGLQPKGDLDFLEGVREPDARQMVQLGDYGRTDVEIPAELARRLLPQISRPEVELPIMEHTIRLFTERGIVIDLERLDRLEFSVTGRTRRLVEASGTDPATLRSDKKFGQVLGQALAATGRELPTKAGTRGPIPKIAKKDPEMKAMVHDADPTVAYLATARLRQKSDTQKLATFNTVRNIATATGGVLPPYLTYYGAHTGRFSGGGSVSLQNLGKDEVGVGLRKTLSPASGHLFVSLDSAQIEARTTAWFAGEADQLDAFRAGRDVYSEFASELFAEPVYKPDGSEPQATQKRLKALRQVGKQAVLGLGFGMGARRFLETLEQDPDAARLLASGELDACRCRDIVHSYRIRYSAIPELWDASLDAARHALDGLESEVAGVRFAKAGDEMRIWLPSGRFLRYPQPRLDPTPRTLPVLNEYGELDEFTTTEPSIVYGTGHALYGGKLCENIVQATARDALVESILAVERAGFPVLFHVHDEVVVQARKDEAWDAAADLKELLERPPEWAPDLPVEMEVAVMSRYGRVARRELMSQA